MKRVGIYSGTFDPVHEGHLAFAREALAQCKLDKVFFLVEPRPRRKQGVRALEHRDEMVRIAIKNDPKFGSIQLGHQRFTSVDTLPVLQERFKGAELYMLMGDDGFRHFATSDWPHVEFLVENIRFAIGLRELTRDEVNGKIDALQVTKGWHMNYKLFQAPKAEFSSTAIKRQLRKGMEPEGLGTKVLEYIRTNDLYSVADKP